MNRVEWTVLAALTALILWQNQKTKAATGTVDFETPTISGSDADNFGGTDYATSDGVM